MTKKKVKAAHLSTCATRRVVGARLAFQANVIKNALERTGHTGAIQFFEETLRLNAAALAKAEGR